MSDIPFPVFAKYCITNTKGAVAFARKLGGVRLTPDQIKALRAIWKHRRIAIRSGHGTGKSHGVAWAMAAFGCLFPKGRITLTAATGRQVRGTVWDELKRCVASVKNPADGDLCLAETEIGAVREQMWRRGDRIVAEPFTVEPSQASAFQGRHAPQMLVVLDEAAGIDERIYDAAETLATGQKARLVIVGNPTNPGPFQKACEGGLYHVVDMSCFTHPNVILGKEEIGGAVTREWIDDAWAKRGDGRPIKWETPLNLATWADWPRLRTWKHPWWQGHVIGQFPAASDDALIAWEAITKACDLVCPRSPGRTLGVDVARYGKDETVLVTMEGKNVVDVEAHPRTSGPQVVALVREVSRRQRVPASGIRIDATGIGGMGVVDWMAEDSTLTLAEKSWWGLCHGEEFGGKPFSEDGRFLNRRAELAWGLKEKMEKGEIGLGALPEPHRSLLADQLKALRYKYTPTGKLAVEAKEDYRKRTGRSPDHAEALMLAAWPDPDAAIDFADKNLSDRDKLAALGIVIPGVGPTTTAEWEAERDEDAMLAQLDAEERRKEEEAWFTVSDDDDD